MKLKLQLFLLKAKVALIGIGKVLIKPHYLLATIIFIFLAANLIIWSLNFELATFIIREPSLSLADKLEFFSSSVRDIFTTYESNQAFGIAIFSILFGINISVLIYVLSHIGLKKIAKQSGASGAGLIFAILAGGCVACGTSLLAPILVTLGATSSLFLRDLSLWLMWISSALILIALFQIGQLAKTAQVESKRC